MRLPRSAAFRRAWPATVVGVCPPDHLAACCTKPSDALELEVRVGEFGRLARDLRPAFPCVAGAWRSLD